MALAFDATSNSGNKSSVSSYSWSHTCTGSNLILVVGITAENASDTGQMLVDGVTYNGVAMTKANDQDTTVTPGGSSNYSSIWYLKNPATGANSIAVTHHGTVVASVGMAVSYTGADQTTQPDVAGNGNKANSGTGSVAITSSTNGAVYVDVLNGSGSGNALTVDGTQTQRQNITFAGNFRAGMSTFAQTLAGAKTMQWTFTSQVWAMSALAIRPSTGTNVTVNPGAQSVTSSLPSPTISAVRNPTILAGVQSATFSQPSATVQISDSTAPSAQTAAFSQPSPTITTIRNPTTSAAAQTITTSQPTPTVTTTRFVTISPNAQTVIASQPTPTLTATRNVTTSQAVQVTTFSLQSPSVQISDSTTANAQTVTFSQPSPTITTTRNPTISPSAQTSTVSQPAVTITTTRNPTVSPSEQSAVFSQPSPTVTAVRVVTVSPSAQSATFSTPSASVTIGETLAQAVQALTFSQPSPTVTTIRNPTISQSAQALTATIISPTVSITAPTNVTVSVPVLTIGPYRLIFIDGNPGLQVSGNQYIKL